MKATVALFILLCPAIYTQHPRTDYKITLDDIERQSAISSHAIDVYTVSEIHKNIIIYYSRLGMNTEYYGFLSASDNESIKNLSNNADPLTWMIIDSNNQDRLDRLWFNLTLTSENKTGTGHMIEIGGKTVYLHLSLGVMLEKTSDIVIGNTAQTVENHIVTLVKSINKN